MYLMRFLFATDITVCHLYHISKDWMNFKAITCTVTIIDEPKRSKVIGHTLNRFCLCDSNEKKKQNKKKTWHIPDKIVLVIGGGPSAIDLCHAISKWAKTVVFSHHTHNLEHVYESNVIRKGSIQRFTKNGVLFIDGSEIDITDIVFCTGQFDVE